MMLTACKDERSNEGDRYYKQGKYEEAVKSYTEFLRLNPKDVKSLYNRGRAYQELGQTDKALEDFNQVIKEDPNNTNAYLSLANDYYYRLKDFDNAIFYADRVLKIDAQNEVAFTLKGKAYQKLGKLSEALEAYNNALSVNERYADAYLSRGSLRIYQKQNSRACTDFNQAKSLGAEGVDELINKYCR